MAMRIPTLLLISALLCCGSLVLGQETLREFQWDSVGVAPVADAALLAADSETPFARLEIRNARPAAKTVTVLVIDDPSLTARRYALRGRVRCAQVDGKAYLEMWSTFPDQKRAYSRTLDARGLARPLTGTAGWREFSVPFYLRDGGAVPVALELNVVLPGPGTVWLGPVQLVQYDGLADPLAPTGAWWGARHAGYIGGIGGGLIGMLGALVGVLAALGRLRRAVVGVCILMVVGGVASLVAGLVAVLGAQPYAVYYPLLLGGGLCALLPAVLLPVILTRYRQAELQRMHALDAGAAG